MAKKEDQVTKLAREGMALQEEFGRRIREVVGAPTLDAEGLYNLYTRANFEQRHAMFVEVLGSQGADGLELLGDVFRLANEQFRGEG